MPFFVYRGKIICAIMAFKAHCGFHLWGPEMREVLREAGYTGKDSSGLFGRITTIADLPEDKLLRGWLTQAFKMAGEDGPAKSEVKVKKAAKTVKAPLVAPEDLQVELGKRAGAAANFAGLSPSCRKEYIEWIEEAKRAETRARRVATAAEWIAEGKRRNWKSETGSKAGGTLELRG